jgi:hypothetical protein
VVNGLRSNDLLYVVWGRSPLEAASRLRLSKCGARSEFVEAKGLCINPYTILGFSSMHALAVRSASLSLI